MRLFLNSGITGGYRRYFSARHRGEMSFDERKRLFLDDRFGAPHFLKPVLDGDETAFFTNGDDELLQQAWAAEHGVPWTGDLSATLLAQIEDHRTEVFYNLDPLRFGSDFVRQLPGCVKHSICWRAAPSPGADFAAYDLVVCNFPNIIEDWRKQGYRADYFSPGHDPEMDKYAKGQHRPIDICFVGGYSRHHRKRGEVLEAVAGLANRFDIRFCLDRSRLTRLAEHPLARLLPMGRHRRPRGIQAVSRDPVFGQEFYSLLGSSKVVLNGAIDMAENYRGNMRCFEAMGTGTLLVSDAGVYPEGMQADENMLVYSSPEEAVQLIEGALDNWEQYSEMGLRAHQMVSSRYSKERQWQEFRRLVDTI